MNGLSAFWSLSSYQGPLNEDLVKYHGKIKELCLIECYYTNLIKN